jgi:hypothetical protein
MQCIGWIHRHQTSAFGLRIIEQLFDATPVRPKATRSVVLGLDAPFVAGAWAKAASGYKEAIMMLEADCGWSGSRTLPYPPLVVTIAAWQAVTKGWAPADRLVPER